MAMVEDNGTICQLMKDYDAVEAERDAALEKGTALTRELERWRHGNTIEGDFVCPNALERDTALARVAELEHLFELGAKTIGNP